MAAENSISNDIPVPENRAIGSSTVDDVKAKIGELAEPLKDAVEPLKEKAGEIAKDKVGSGANNLHTFAKAVHGAANELEQEMPKFVSYVHDAGSPLDSAATGMSERNIEELLSDFDSFARQQPAVVFGAATLAGFVLARFLKSSSSPETGGRDTASGLQ